MSSTQCQDCGHIFTLDEDPIPFNGESVCRNCCKNRAIKILRDAVKMLLFASRKLHRVDKRKWGKFLEAVQQMEKEVGKA